MDYKFLLIEDVKKEIAQQPTLYMEWVEKAADARAEAEAAKLKLDIYEAETLMDIRTDPKKYKLEKVNETVILNTLALLVEHQKLKMDVIKKRRESEKLYGIIRALEQKETALSNLIKHE